MAQRAFNRWLGCGTPKAVECCSAVRRSAAGWSVSREWSWTKRPEPHRLHTVGFHFGYILEMTKLQDWRTDGWLPVSELGCVWEESGCICTRAAQADRDILLLNCIDRCWCITDTARRCHHRRLQGKGYTGLPLLFLYIILDTCVWVYSYLIIQNFLFRNIVSLFLEWIYTFFFKNLFFGHTTRHMGS